MAGINQRQTEYHESPNTFERAVTCSSALTVAGAITSSGALTASGTLTASSSALVSGGLTVSKTITGSSAATIAGTLTASSSALVSGGLTVSKTITGSSNMAITGTGSVGGTFTASSSAAVTGGLTVSGTLTGSSNLAVTGTATLSGGLFEAMQTVATTSGALNAYGISVLSNTSAMAVTIGAPVAGAQKVIYNIANTTKVHTVTTDTTSQTFDSTGTILTFNAIDQFVRLVGYSSTRWLVVSSSGNHSGIS